MSTLTLMMHLPARPHADSSTCQSEELLPIVGADAQRLPAGVPHLGQWAAVHDGAEGIGSVGSNLDQEDDRCSR